MAISSSETISLTENYPVRIRPSIYLQRLNLNGAAVLSAVTVARRGFGLFGYCHTPTRYGKLVSLLKEQAVLFQNFTTCHEVIKRVGQQRFASELLYLALCDLLRS